MGVAYGENSVDRFVFRGQIEESVRGKRELRFKRDNNRVRHNEYNLARMVLDRHEGVRVMRDPARGGLTASMVELATSTGMGFEIDEI